MLEVEELSRRLEESDQILWAIKSGAVDAVVVSTDQGPKIFTLQGAEHPYRVLVETMSEGAVTMDSAGIILYCNSRFAAMLELPMEKIIGSAFETYLAPEDLASFNARTRKHGEECYKQETSLVTRSAQYLPVLLSCCSMGSSGPAAASIIITDISSRKQTERTILRLNRLYAVLSGTNHAIVHAPTADSLFHEFCHVAVKAGGFTLAWVGLLDRVSGALKIAAASGETAYLDGLEARVDAEPERRTPAAIAMTEGGYYICNIF